MTSLTAPITIRFEVKRREVLNDVIFERFEFWNAPSTIQWFRERGYTLYTRLPSDNGEVGPTSIPTVSCDDGQVAASYPYAHYETTVTKQGQISLRAWEMQGKVGFAQDFQNRHVAIKIVPAGSEEYRILDFLQQQDLETLKENCILPVLDVLPIDGFYFVVMPRWGANVDFPWPQKVFEILPIMHSMLKALNFLHRHKIAHGDINLSNILVNQFDDAVFSNEQGMRQKLRSEGVLLYALFDFDFSFKPPAETDRMRFKIRADMTLGEIYTSTNATHRNRYINPFIADVGWLGVLFCRNYQHLTGIIPLLAPFLDKLTTHILSDRFTANEALLFFESNILNLTEAELNQRVQAGEIVNTSNESYLQYDRWADVPPDFAQHWAHYRTPSMPQKRSFLYKICRIGLGSSIANWIQRGLTLFTGGRDSAIQ